MLLGTHVAELAQPLVGGGLHAAQHGQHLAAAGGELAGRVGLGQLLDGLGILLGVDEPAAAVAPVVVDVEGLVARRGRSELRQVAVGVGLEVVGTGLDVGLEVVASPGTGSQHDGQD